MTKKILAVASKGGHWIQLQCIAPAFAGHRCTYVSTMQSYARDVAPSRFIAVRDATRWNKFGLLVSALQMFWILVRERPDVVLSTGAAPGYFAILFGKLFGAKTVWIDSVANAEQLSLSGQLAGRFADLWLTQWRHLARPGGPNYIGSVL